MRQESEEVEEILARERPKTEGKSSTGGGGGCCGMGGGVGGGGGGAGA